MCSDPAKEYPTVLNRLDVRGTTVLRVIGRLWRPRCNFNTATEKNKLVTNRARARNRNRDLKAVSSYH